MIDNELKLNTLLKTYECVLNDIWRFQNEGDNGNWLNIVAGLSGLVLSIIGASPTLITVICFFVPILQLLSLQRGSQAHTFVAMLRGYAAYLEDEINNLIGENYMLYNSVYIDRFIANQKVVKSKGLKTSWLVTFLMHFGIIGICIAVIIYHLLFKTWWYYLAIGIIFAIYTALIASNCKAFAKKEQKRFEARYPRELLDIAENKSEK